MARWFNDSQHRQNVLCCDLMQLEIVQACRARQLAGI
jgi:hypothetical protein